MRFILLLFSSLMLLGLNTGCQQGGDFKYDIAVVDSLQISLDEVVFTYKKWDVDSLINLKTATENELNYLTKVLKESKDTLSREEGLFFGDYKSNSSSFKRVKSNNHKFLQEIELSNKQLASLKKDLLNGAIGDPDSVKLFLKKEKESVGILIQSLARINKIYDTGLDKHAKMNPRITNILDSLTNRNNN